jgi:hypothetical protein
MQHRDNIMPTFYRLHPRKFQNEYNIGIATTAADADQYEAEGYREVSKDEALHALSMHVDGQQYYIGASVNGEGVEDRLMLARRIRHGVETHAGLTGEE